MIGPLGSRQARERAAMATRLRIIYATPADRRPVAMVPVWLDGRLLGYYHGWPGRYEAWGADQRHLGRFMLLRSALAAIAREAAE